MSSLQDQVAGTHYKNLKYQPVELSHNLHLSGIQLLIIKYLTRYRNKNGREDLIKARHCCQLATDLNDIPFYKHSLSFFETIIPQDYYHRVRKVEEVIEKECRDFCRLNTMYKIYNAVLMTCKGNWSSAYMYITEILEEFDNEQRRAGEQDSSTESAS